MSEIDRLVRWSRGDSVAGYRTCEGGLVLAHSHDPEGAVIDTLFLLGCSSRDIVVQHQSGTTALIITVSVAPTLCTCPPPGRDLGRRQRFRHFVLSGDIPAAVVPGNITVVGSCTGLFVATSYRVRSHASGHGARFDHGTSSSPRHSPPDTARGNTERLQRPAAGQASIRLCSPGGLSADEQACVHDQRGLPAISLRCTVVGGSRETSHTLSDAPISKPLFITISWVSGSPHSQPREVVCGFSPKQTSSHPPSDTSAHEQFFPSSNCLLQHVRRGDRMLGQLVRPTSEIPTDPSVDHLVVRVLLISAT